MAGAGLKTAVLGLDEQGRNLLEAACQLEYFQIEAVADKDTNLAEKVSREYNCQGYDDYRQLVVQNKFDCLLVAAGLHTCDEYVRAAMKKKCNILKLAPLARNFEEAFELVRLAENEKVRFAVANPMRFSETFGIFREFLGQNTEERIYLLTAVCNYADGSWPGWQSDPKLAGGGVLLYNCYEIIDEIIYNFSVPQQVYSLNTNTAGDRQQRLRLTEDTAIVTMKFTDTFFVNLTASRLGGDRAQDELLTVHSKNKIIILNCDLFCVKDCSGNIITETAAKDNRSDRMKAQLKNFALSILQPDKNKLCSSARENLKNMAVIESAYLSARTASPEEPDRIALH